MWFVFFLHGGDGARCWFDKNLVLCGVGNGGSTSMALYEHASNQWRAKFLDLKKTMCYLIGVFGMWFSKSWGFEMAMFRQLMFVREECPKIQEVLWIDGIVIPLCHFLLFCVGWRILYIIGNNWRRWWTNKRFQKRLDCGICGGKERWFIFGIECWFGVWKGVPISMRALKRIIVTWTSRGLLVHYM